MTRPTTGGGDRPVSGGIPAAQGALFFEVAMAGVSRYAECPIMNSGVAASLGTTGLSGSKALHNFGAFQYASPSPEERTCGHKPRG